MREAVNSVLWWCSFALCGLVLIAHFSLVQLSNMPMSPLKLQLANIISFYVNPYFSQQWGFFAPQPVDRDVFLLARGRYMDKKTGEVTTGPWINVSDGLIDALRKNRLSALFHVEVILSNAVVQYCNSLVDNPRATFKKDGQTYVKAQIPADAESIDMRVMKRTAIASLEIAYPDQPIEEIQLGLMTYVFPRFTVRYKAVADEPAAVTLVDWQPAEWVSPYCCYRGKSVPLVDLR